MAEANIFVDVGRELESLILPAIIISFLGAISNILLLVAFVKDPLKCFRNSGTFLVMNLAVSDCLTCLISSVAYIRRRADIHPIFYFAMYWFGGVSMISIVSISIDRFLMVTHPIKHRILMNGKVMILWISAIWIVSCVIPVLRLLSDSETIDQHVMNIFSAIAIVLSAVLYATTYHKLKKQSRSIALQNSSESRAQETRILKETRFLKTIIIVACIAFVCVVPPMAFALVYNSLSFGTLASKVVGAISIFSVCLNFAVNPLVYTLRLPNYRKTFYFLYCGRRRASS